MQQANADYINSLQNNIVDLEEEYMTKLAEVMKLPEEE